MVEVRLLLFQEQNLRSQLVQSAQEPLFRKHCSRQFRMRLEQNMQEPHMLVLHKQEHNQNRKQEHHSSEHMHFRKELHS